MKEGDHLEQSVHHNTAACDIETTAPRSKRDGTNLQSSQTMSCMASIRDTGPPAVNIGR